MAAMYDEFTFTGVKVKYFQIPNFGGNAYILSEIMEDNNSMWNPSNPITSPLSIYGNFQTIGLNAQNLWSRYFPMAKLKKNLGISWCATSDANFTYYGQLQGGVNPSFTARNVHVGTIPNTSQYTTAEITWYYAFRGLKSATAANLAALMKSAEEGPEPLITE